MDDLYFAVDTEEEAKETVEALISTLEKGIFPLSKWVSNRPEVLEKIPKE